MKLKLIYLKSQDSAIVKELSRERTDERTDRVISPNNIREENPQILIYSHDLQLEEFQSFLAQETKFYPVISSDQVSLTADEMVQLSWDQGQQIMSQIYTKWILAQNLQTIEEIFALQQHLKTLLQKDYTCFFEELWFILKRNLGTSSLRIIFHDVNESGKGKLTHSFVDGDRLPRPQAGGDIEKNLMELHAPHFLGRPFQICHYDENAGKMVATAHIRQSPILIMAELYFCNKLQKALLSSLFEGLQQV